LIYHRYYYQERGENLDYESILEDESRIAPFKQALELDAQNYWAAKRLANHYDSVDKNFESLHYFTEAVFCSPVDEEEKPMLIYKRGSIWLSCFEEDMHRSLTMIPDVLRALNLSDKFSVKDVVNVLKYFYEQAKQAETINGPVPRDFSGKTYLESAIDNYEKMKKDVRKGRKEIKSTKSCAHCGKSGSEVSLKLCAKCGNAFYCSRDCQLAAWPEHKKSCKKPGPEEKRETVIVGPEGYRVENTSLLDFTQRQTSKH
jgi:hypothetical protein